MYRKYVGSFFNEISGPADCTDWKCCAGENDCINWRNCIGKGYNGRNRKNSPQADGIGKTMSIRCCRMDNPKCCGGSKNCITCKNCSCGTDSPNCGGYDYTEFSAYDSPHLVDRIIDGTNDGANTCTDYCADDGKSFQERISSNLKTLRLMRGLSQEDVACIISVSRTKYNRIEKGRTCPDIITLCGLLSYYNISLEVLLGM